MKALPHLPLLILLAALTLVSPTQAQQYTYPDRVPSYLINSGNFQFAGLIRNTERNVTGSATVTRHPNIATSAAHVTFDYSVPLSNNRFYLRHHSGSLPSVASGTLLRGYWYWTSYRGTNSAADFSRDFIAYYNYSSLANGGHAGWWYSDSTTSHPLNRFYSKEMIGYPGTDAYYMNVTSFYSRFYRRYNHYFFDNTSTVRSGMSGGGAFVYNNGWYQAGVIVSGITGYTGAGVRAFNKASHSLTSSAIRSAEAGAPSYGSFSNNDVLSIRDASTVWTTKRIEVFGLPSRVRQINLSMLVDHTYPQDLQIKIQSPSGRTRLIFNRFPQTTGPLFIDESDFTSGFSGVRANGIWRVSVRDRAREDVGFIRDTRLTIGATY
jgi:subtilisin-like proprotein convertase family protein